MSRGHETGPKSSILLTFANVFYKDRRNLTASLALTPSPLIPTGITIYVSLFLKPVNIDNIKTDEEMPDTRREFVNSNFFLISLSILADAIIFNRNAR